MFKKFKTIKKLILSITGYNNDEKHFFSSSVLKTLLQRGVFYNFISTFMQLNDLKNIEKINFGKNKQNNHFDNVAEYNSSILNDKIITTSRRFDLYYQFLTVPQRSLVDEKLLIVGPRNRAELLTAWLHGFRWKNIFAIDLFSTNKKIIVMNMEKMTWKDNYFDNVVMSMTLSYAKNVESVIQEVSRILKDGGRFSFSQTTVMDGKRWESSKFNGKKIHNLLSKNGFSIKMHFPEHKVNSSLKKQTIHSFLAMKNEKKLKIVDDFKL